MPTACSQAWVNVPPPDPLVVVRLAEPDATITAAPTITVAEITASLRSVLITVRVSLLSPRRTTRGSQWPMTSTSTAGHGLAVSPVRPHVECVTKTVSEQIERKRGHHEEQAWEEHQPPGHVVVVLRVVQKSRSEER